MNVNNGKKQWLALCGVGLSSFLGCIDFTIVNTALPDIQNEFSSSFSTLQWVMNIFVIALSSMMVIMGRLGDIFGHKKVFYVGVFAFGISSIMAAISPSLSFLILARLIQGISCAILFTNSGAIISHIFPTNQQGKALGILFGINGLGLAAGPFIGGLLVNYLGWRWIFYINLPVVAIVLITCLCALPKENFKASNGQLDAPGAVLVTFILACISLIFTQGSDWGWGSNQIIGLTALSFSCFGIFCLVEKKSPDPILNFGLMKNTQFSSSSLASFTLGAFYSLAFFLMPLYLDNVLHLSALDIGLMLLPTTAGVAIISPMIGKVVDKLGCKPVILFGLSLLACSAGLQSLFGMNENTIFILIAFLCMGIGWGCVLSPSMTAAVTSVPQSYTGAAIGNLGTIQNIGASLGLAIGVAVFNSQFVEHISAQLAESAQFAISPGNLGKLVDAVVTNFDIQADIANNIILSGFMKSYSSAMLLLAGICSVSFLILLGKMRPATIQGVTESTCNSL